MDIIKGLIPLLAIALSSCANDPETCVSHGDASFDKAIALKLDKLKFTYKLKRKGSICFKQSKTPEYKKIEHEVAQYYNAVATVLKSKKNKNAVFGWLKSENIHYYTHDNDRGTFIAIGSLTEDLAIENAIKLNELVYGN